MADLQKITIKFQPEGHKNLIDAIKRLDKATKQLEGKLSSYEVKSRKATKTTNSLGSSFGLATASMRNMGTGALNLSRSISIVRSRMLLLAFAIGGVNRAVDKRVSLYREQLQSETALASNLRNVESASEGAAQELIQYATQLQNVTTFGDEQIISASAMLATFQLNETAIKSILPRLLDMSASTGTLEGNAIALGKAFTGNAGNLGRYGVVIDKSGLQMARAKGNAEEFSFIIEQLDNNFKGLATALAETEIGQLDQLENRIGDINEEIGKVSLPFKLFMAEVRLVSAQTFAFISIIFEEYKKLGDGSTFKGMGKGLLAFFTDIAAQINPVLADMIDVDDTDTKDFLAGLQDRVTETFNSLTSASEAYVDIINKGNTSNKNNAATEKVRNQLLKDSNKDLKEQISLLQNEESKKEKGNSLLLQENIIKTKLDVLNKQLADELINEQDHKIAVLDLDTELNNLRKKSAEEIKKENEAIQKQNAILKKQQEELAKLAQQREMAMEEPFINALSEISLAFGSVTFDMQNMARTANETFSQMTEDGFSHSETTTAVYAQMAAQIGAAFAQAAMQASQARMDSIKEQAQADIQAFKQTERYNKLSERQKKSFERDKLKVANQALKKEFEAQQKMQRAGVVMNTAAAIMEIWARPTMGVDPVTKGVLTGFVTALSLAQLAEINSQQAPKMASGGYIGGKLHSQGGTMIEAERGEFIMSRSAVDSVGLETMNRINQGGGAINVSFNGNVMSGDFIENEAIPKIKEAVRRGADIGVS